VEVKIFEKVSSYLEKLKHPATRAWLGVALVVIGLGLLIYWSSQLDYFEPQPDNINSTTIQQLPSGEEATVKVAVENISPAKAVTDKHMIIPKIGVDADIYQGGIESLSKGLWLLPGTSTPDQGSNTVISAHRWLYLPPDPRTFYNLDKMEIGDRFTIQWQGAEYTYEVYEIKIVNPEQVEILDATKDPIVTLFSCTPLYSTEKRLVVRAKQVALVD